MTHQARLEHSEVVLTNTHGPDECWGEHCTIHNRSDHHLRHFPQAWHDTCGMMDRVCPHGIGHPDPDEYRIRLHPILGVHGCDGCCHA